MEHEATRSETEQQMSNEITPIERPTESTPSLERLGSEPRRLAAVELPIEVTPLCAIADGLVAKYGKSVTMRQAGTHLVFDIPNTAGQRPARNEATHE
jgi:hypothetical protein